MEELKEQLNNQSAINWQKEMLCLAVVIVVGLLFAAPMFLNGFPSDTHDAPPHFGYYKLFAQQFFGGELYPRWLADANAGFGSPVFFFNAPLPYFVAAVFGLFLGAPATDAQVWQQLGLSATVALIGSGITCYLFLRGIVNSFPATLASVIYLIVPYHISVDLYTRGTISEFWTFVWMPLILMFVRELRKKLISSFIGLSLSYSLLIMTHLPTTLIFTAVLLSFALFLAVTRQSKAQFILTVLGMGIGFGIADIFLVPAMVARNFVSLEPNPESPLYFAKSFLFSSISSNDNNPFIYQLSIVVGTMILGVFLCSLLGKAKPDLKNEQRFWLAVSIITIFLMIPFSKPIWQLVTFIQIVQFPFRMAALLCLGLTVLSAIAFSNISFTKELISNKTNLLILIGIIVLCIGWAGFFIKNLTADKIPENVKPYRERVLTQLLTPYESMPKSARLDLIDKLIAEREKSGSKYLLRTDKPQTKIEVSRWKPRDIILNVSATETTTLTVGQFYYPVWEAVFQPESGQLVKLEVKLSEEGLVQTQVPAGKGQIGLSLVTSGVENSGFQTSLISLVAMIVGAFILRRYRNYFGFERGEVVNG